VNSKPTVQVVGQSWIDSRHATEKAKGDGDAQQRFRTSRSSFAFKYDEVVHPHLRFGKDLYNCRLHTKETRLKAPFDSTLVLSPSSSLIM
jgi:hypothetical protein